MTDGKIRIIENFSKNRARIMDDSSPAQQAQQCSVLFATKKVHTSPLVQRDGSWPASVMTAMVSSGEPPRKRLKKKKVRASEMEGDDDGSSVGTAIATKVGVEPEEETTTVKVALGFFVKTKIVGKQRGNEDCTPKTKLVASGDMGSNALDKFFKPVPQARAG